MVCSKSFHQLKITQKRIKKLLKKILISHIKENNLEVIMRRFFYIFFLSSFSFCADASSGATLLTAINNFNSGGGDDTINFTASFGIEDTNRRPLFTNNDFTASAQPLALNISSTGARQTLQNFSASQSTGFFMRAGVTNIDNLNFSNLVARGGSNGATSGAGGAAMGGAIFIYNGAVASISNASFTNCSAVGGQGGTGTFGVSGGSGAGCASTGGPSSVGGGGFYGAGSGGGGGGGCSNTVGVGGNGGPDFGGANGGPSPGGNGGPGGGGAFGVNGGGDGGFGGGGGGQQGGLPIQEMGVGLVEVDLEMVQQTDVLEVEVDH